MRKRENMPEIAKQKKAEEKKLSQEIERKFLVKELPENLEQYPHTEHWHGYLAVDKDNTEIRLRQIDNQYSLTVKQGTGKIRTEIKIKISEEKFKKLWPITEGKRIHKTRYRIPCSAGTIELDVYHDDLDGLIVAEIEFDSEKDSNKFEPPQWFGQEVTEDQRFKNQNLAQKGLPKDFQIKSEIKKEQLNIPEYELEEGLDKLIDSIRKKMAEQKRPVVVEIAGGSSSGKTSVVAAKIKEIFGDQALILSMDDYYYGKTYMKSKTVKGNKLNWDQPEALKLDLLQQHLKKLKENKAIEKPIYDMKISEVVDKEKIQPKKIIILEGIFALNDILKQEGDIKVFVDIGTHGRILRRLLRDIERTDQKPADIIKYFAEVVEPMHEKHILSTKKNADMIINNEYKAEVEAQKSGLHEIQLKFKGEIDPEKLRKLGLNRLISTIQIDNYYNPRDRNLIETSEMLRIREEGEHFILTYKGPKTPGKFKMRPKFEFEIDEETKNKFLSIYGDTIKIIKKDRTLYQLDGVVFSVDKVAKIEKGRKTDLGNFIEIMSTDKDFDEKKIKEALKNLGLNLSESLKKSYFEM